VVEALNEGTDLVRSTAPTYTLPVNVENLLLLGTAALNGTGNTLANTLYPNAGNNVLDGSTGSDTVSYAYAAAAVQVNLTLSTAQATGGSGSDTLLNVENLTGSPFADTLTGNAAANVLDGKAGTDTLTGKAGNDSYYVDNTGDQVVEVLNEGTDLVRSTAPTYTLPANVENLLLLGTAARNGTGNALANTLYPSLGNNVLDGGGGTDTVSYFLATAAVRVSLALTTAQVTGGSGSDTLLNVENLTGSPFADTLTGNNANNTLNGGAGLDTLIGGAGQDSFLFNTALNANSNVDRLPDFLPVDDTLRLENAVFTTLTSTGTLAATAFGTGPVATTAAQRILYDQNTGALAYDPDGNGATAPVHFATLTTRPTLANVDFVVQ